MSATETTAEHPGQIIHNQIGRRAFFMLGAQDVFLTEHEGRKGLRFKIRGSQAGNFVRVTLDVATDTYVVELVKSRGLSWKPVARREGIYAERLHATIESLTGLRTSL